MKIGSKMWPLLCSQGFQIIWPSDLVFDPTWPRFELDLDFIETNILTKFHEDWVKNVASIVFTRFSNNLTQWPSFWADVTQIRTWPRFHRDKHSDQDSWRLGQKCGLYCVHKAIVYGRTHARTHARTHGRRTPRHRISSSGLWPVELKMIPKMLKNKNNVPY